MGQFSAARINHMGHFEQLSHLLELEGAEEAKRLAEETRSGGGAAAERSGRCLLKLALRDEQPALGGRVLATLAKRDQTQMLPWNRLSVGTPVLLTEENVDRQRGWRGVVCRRDAASLDVVLAESPEPQQDRPTFRLDISSDEVSRQRQQAALAQARLAERGRVAYLRDVLLGRRPLKQNEQRTFTPFDSSLNSSQRQAVEFALAA